MDPLEGVPLGKYDRLPRTRGDGPFIQGLRLASASAPPHPRGWTRRERSTN